MIEKTKRLRIFAGPNGSGKSTLIEAFKNNNDSRIKLGIVVNADEIEKNFIENGFVDFSDFQLTISENTFISFISSSGLIGKKYSKVEILNSFKVDQNKLTTNLKLDSYIAADISEFIRQSLLNEGISFSFETVFSHPSKLEIIKKAKSLGYRIYFYFITTDNVEININRVAIRVLKKGHFVSTEKIKERYTKSLNQLFDAVKLSDRCFLFDNSSKHYELVASIEAGRKVEMNQKGKNIPNWFHKYVVEKASS